MGLFDTIELTWKTEKPEGAPEEAQVKCWGSNLNVYHIGDSVPDVNGVDSYVIALREGGFLYVEAGEIVGWQEKLHPDDHLPVFDKWGDIYEGPSAPTGLLGESYRRE